MPDIPEGYELVADSSSQIEAEQQKAALEALGRHAIIRPVQAEDGGTAVDAHYEVWASRVPSAPNAYEAKQEARRERYGELAEKAAQRARAADAAARRISDMIPLGQPILIGHHSEARHRRDLERIRGGYAKAHEESSKADYYVQKAAGIGTGGISSDDPDAIPKLQKELAEVLAKQERMKQINAALRKPKEKGDAILRDLGFTPEGILQVRTPDCMGCIGFPSYALQNNSANARRIQKRIKVLEAKAGDVTTERRVGEVRIVDNVELNRLQLFFPGKPSEEVRAKLKRRGFRWSPREGAWQAFRSNRAKWAAGAILGAPLDKTPEVDAAPSEACILPPESDADDCTTHGHEPPADPPAPESGTCPDGAGCSQCVKLQPGQRVEVETPEGWKPGTFLGYRDEGEEFQRLDVKSDEEWRSWRGCHPRSVRPAGALPAAGTPPGGPA